MTIDDVYSDRNLHVIAFARAMRLSWGSDIAGWYRHDDWPVSRSTRRPDRNRGTLNLVDVLECVTGGFLYAGSALSRLGERFTHLTQSTQSGAHTVIDTLRNKRVRRDLPSDRADCKRRENVDSQLPWVAGGRSGWLMSDCR